MTKFNHFAQIGEISSEKSDPQIASDFPVSDPTMFEQSDRDITMLHYHDYFEIGYCYQGSGIFVIEDKIYPFQAGDASLIHRGRIHLAQSAKGTSSQWRFLSLDVDSLTSYFNDDQRPLLSEWQRTGNSSILKRSSHEKTLNLIRDIIEELVQKDAHYQELIRFKLGELMLQSLRDDANQHAPEALEKKFNSKSFQRIRPALQHIISNYASAIAIDDLAELCHLSPAQFRRLFTAAMGTSPQSYLSSIRINHAEQLLQSTSFKIVDIAEKVGFGTLSSFNRAFLLALGYRPKDVRKSHTS
jgi:AraC family transcriptional regulator, activator of mtrCDE